MDFSCILLDVRYVNFKKLVFLFAVSMEVSGDPPVSIPSAIDVSSENGTFLIYLYQSHLFFKIFNTALGDFQNIYFFANITNTLEIYFKNPWFIKWDKKSIIKSDESKYIKLEKNILARTSLHPWV